MKMFVKRPTTKDSDDDLLRQQEEFFKSNTTPSVRKIAKAEKTKDATKPLQSNDVFPQISSTSETLKVQVQLSNNATEKKAFSPHLEKHQSQAGEGKPPPKKKSIFAQEMEKKKRALLKDSKIEMVHSSPEETKSIIIDGSGLGDPAEVERIRKENELFIKSHTFEELHETIAELSHLKPYIDIIRAKRHSSVAKNQVSSSMSQSSNQQIIKEDETKPIQVCPEDLPINVEEARKWPHMDVLEEEKLAWMTPLPQPKQINEGKRQSTVVRFDFKGAILPSDLDVPTQMGLHHHGEEPERAGYSIDELFTLSRSQVPGQRQISLETFANILKKYWEGCYDKCFDHPLLSTLLERGLALLLRHSLDDSSNALISAAVGAIYHLIVSEMDELCLDHIFFWDGGSINPYLYPDAFNKEEEEDIDKLSDVAILKNDVIKGFLRMDILPRLRYILEVCQPEAEVVVQIVAIVTRIARHSLSSATKVYECPRLVPSLVSSFLPTHWKSAKTIGEQMASAYDMPLAPVLKLFRVLAMAGPSLASRIMHTHKITEALKIYLTLYEKDDKLPNKISMILHVEAYRMWNVLASHSLGASLLKELLPFTYSHLQSILNLSLKPTLSYSVECSIAIMAVLKSIIESKEVSSLSFDFLQRLKSFAQDFVQHWAQELMNGLWVTSSSLIMVGRALTLYVSLQSYLVGDPNEDVIVEMERLKHFINCCLDPFLKSKAFTELMEECPSRSLYLCYEKTREDPKSLPSLSAVLWANDIVPILGMGAIYNRSTIPFMSLLTESMVALYRTHPSMLNKVAEGLLAHPSVQKYVNKIISSSASSSYFNFIELGFLKNLCLLASLLPFSASSLQTFYYSLALQLPRLAQEMRDPCFFEQVLKQLIFHPSLIHFSHHESTIPLSAKDSARVNIENCNIPVLKQIFLSRLSHSGASSTFLWPPKPTNNKLWPFLPILHTHKKSLQPDFYKDYPQDIKDLEHCLHWICFLKMFHSQVFQEIPPTTQYCLLSLVFLIDDQLSLPNLRFYLEICLKLLINDDLTFHPKRLKKELSCCPLFENFEKHFRDLLHNFVDVSFGDPLFANYLCLPLQASSHKVYKKIAFQEVELLFRFFSLPLDQVIVPLKAFLQPPEKDQEMLSLYCKILATGQVDPETCPLFFMIASHHLAHYLTSSPEDDILREKILALKLPINKYDL